MALHWFCKNIHVPVKLIVDSHRAQTSIKINISCDQVGKILNILEKSTPWANISELYISLLKESVCKNMLSSHSLMVLQYYAIEHHYLIINTIPCPWFENNGLNLHKVTLGEPSDISKICVYGWYEWTYYHDHGTFPENRDNLGGVLVPVKN